ncbi:34513_t:CDS:2 [Gigaspora margarita]|uniref:34513_t:CDS:1 n=1 Tax=Gigaspora margarita TaxID=4874 RepID=A0ABN7UQF0_GIGMA|nr:34513_t:CDS:2 [Gigaspora margarita]
MSYAQNPDTQNLENYYSFETLVKIKSIPSKVLLDQIRTEGRIAKLTELYPDYIKIFTLKL